MAIGRKTTNWDAADATASSPSKYRMSWIERCTPLLVIAPSSDPHSAAADSAPLASGHAHAPGTAEDDAVDLAAGTLHSPNKATTMAKAGSPTVAPGAPATRARHSPTRPRFSLLPGIRFSAATSDPRPPQHANGGRGSYPRSAHDGRFAPHPSVLRRLTAPEVVGFEAPAKCMGSRPSIMSGVIT